MQIDNGTFVYNISSPNIQDRLPDIRHIYSMLQSTTSISSIAYGSIEGDAYVSFLSFPLFSSLFSLFNFLLFSIVVAREATNRLANFTGDYSIFSYFAGVDYPSVYVLITEPTVAIGIKLNHF